MTSSPEATTYDEVYNGDSERSPLEKPISNLLNYDPHIVRTQCEPAQQLIEQEEEDEGKDIFHFFDDFDLNYINTDRERAELADKWSQFLKDKSNFVNLDDHVDNQKIYNNILSDEKYDLFGTENIFSRFPIVIKETIHKSQLDSALGRSWIMEDSIRILRRVCLEIQNHDVFVEFLIKHISEVRRANQGIIEDSIIGGGDIINSYLISNEYEIMLHAAVRQRIETLRGRESELGDEWMKYSSGALFFLILEEINNMLLDPNTELDILLDLIYEEIEIN